MKKFIIMTTTIITISISISSCKNDQNTFSPSETLRETKTMTQKDLGQEQFVKDVYPRIAELFESDSTKYQMIHHIAKKAATEPNKEIYIMNYKDLQGEIKNLE